MSEDPAAAELTLTDGNQEYVLKLDDGPATQRGEVQALLSAAGHQSFILRRRNILRYIDAKPAERGKAIEGFLQLDAFVEHERNLKSLLDEARGNQWTQEQSKRLCEGRLRAALKLKTQDQMDATTCLRELNVAIAGTGLAPFTSQDEVGQRLSDCSGKLAQFGDMTGLPLAVTLSNAAAAVPSISTVLSGGWAYAKAREALLDEEQKLRGHFHKEVLEKGLAWIKEDALANCPLCDHAISVEAVEAYVNRRIAENKTLIVLTEKQDRARTALTSALNDYTAALRMLREKWKPALGDDFPREGELILQAMDVLADAHKQTVAHGVTTSQMKSVEETQIDPIIRGLRQRAENKVQSYSNRQEYETLLRAAAVMQSVASDWMELASIEARLAKAMENASQLSALCVLAEEARKTVVRKLINGIAKQADRYFQKIHANENIGKPVLSVPDRGTASITLTAVFYGEQGDPRGMYSEGHLDSLGLCIFLAIRRLHYKQHAELALLVLDDVMHSVDGAHRRATADLVFEEFRDHQLVITTHDPLWFEHLKVAARKHCPNRKFTQLRIAGWSITEGPSWGDHQSDYEWLVSPEGSGARPADRAIKAGRLLEEVLCNLCDALTVAVPFRIKGDYTIDPLWTSFYKQVKNHNEFWGAAEQRLNDIESLRVIRSWVGAHWNEWAQQLTTDEAGQFADAVVSLRGLVYCPDCGEFIARIPRLEGVWSCPGEHIRYKRAASPST